MPIPPPPLLALHGAPRELGHQHGTALRSQIHANVATLLGDYLTGAMATPRAVIDAWQQRLREFCFDHWPWLSDEIAGLAEGAGLPLSLAELLNFRAWQYDVYHRGACSSFSLRDADGHVLTGGTLDDPRELYAFVHCAPTQGLRYLSFPIAGTAWANRGLNESGLALGLSSLLCPGVAFDLARLVPVDLVFRELLQFCATVADVAAVCRKFDFFCNLVAVDAHGDVFACSQYCDARTIYPTADGTVALTNHPREPAAAALRARGFTGPEAGSDTVARLDQISAWLADHDSRATFTDARPFLGAPVRAGTVNNPHTAFATIAVPQTDPSILWVAQQPVQSDSFFAFDARTGRQI